MKNKKPFLLSSFTTRQERCVYLLNLLVSLFFLLYCFVHQNKSCNFRNCLHAAWPFELSHSTINSAIVVIFRCTGWKCVLTDTCRNLLCVCINLNAGFKQGKNDSNKRCEMINKKEELCVAIRAYDVIR